MEDANEPAAEEAFLLDFFKALSDPVRLRLAGHLIAGPATLSALAAAAGISASDCSRHVERLTGLGLVRRENEGGRVQYRLDEAWLRECSSALLDSPRSRARAGATDERSRVLAAFVRDGRLLAIPTGDQRKLFVLDLIARRFDAGRTYMEREVSEILKEFYAYDFVTLRRLLVDFQFLNRAEGVYWVGQGRRDPEATAEGARAGAGAGFPRRID